VTELAAEEAIDDDTLFEEDINYLKQLIFRTRINRNNLDHARVPQKRNGNPTKNIPYNFLKGMQRLLLKTLLTNR
jgi:hypothetical protein